MAKIKYDVVIDAVHYDTDGQVAWVRAFRRRGPIFTDWLKIPRSELIADLEDGMRYVIGQRIEYMAGTFDISGSLRLVNLNGGSYLTSTSENVKKDHLPGVLVV
jgi:hypothetical protein